MQQQLVKVICFCCGAVQDEQVIEHEEQVSEVIAGELCDLCVLRNDHRVW